MKTIQSIIILVLFFIIGGCQGKKTEKNEFAIIDVNKSYPTKELIIQDFAKVEYVPLETTDSFLTQANIRTISKKYIVVTNYMNDGNIFIFDRLTGKGLKVINRLGQSGEEYTGVSDIVLSEEANELYVSDYSARKIFIYDLSGNFKRSFNFTDTSYYTYLADYDAEHLIVFKGYSPGIEQEHSCHILLSKKDGHVVKEIKVPIEKPETVVWMEGEATITPQFGLTTATPQYWGLTRMSSDTIYHFTEDQQLRPALVRTPSIHSMDKKKFLSLVAENARYYFLYLLDKDFDLNTMKGFGTKNLMYDKRDHVTFTPVLLNNDFFEEKGISVGVHKVQAERSILSFQTLEADELIEANEKGILKENLKKIIPGLEEDSNPILMIISSK